MTRGGTEARRREGEDDRDRDDHSPRACERPSLRAFRRSAFSLVEMLTTVAVLVIVLGLMVSLARDVRNRSAERVTKDMLVKLDRMMAQYVDRNGQGLPPVAPLIGPADSADGPDAAEPGSPGEGSTDAPLEDAALRDAALRNNTDLAQALRGQGDAKDLVPSFFDAWGNPVVFMPRQHPAIGMAGGDRFFFVSPGPDGRFLPREDNLYSYEVGTE